MFYSIFYNGSIRRIIIIPIYKYGWDIARNLDRSMKQFTGNLQAYTMKNIPIVSCIKEKQLVEILWTGFECIYFKLSTIFAITKTKLLCITDLAARASLLPLNFFWNTRALRVCWRSIWHCSRTSLVCSKCFCISLSFEIHPPKSTVFHLDGSPEKNILLLSNLLSPCAIRNSAYFRGTNFS